MEALLLRTPYRGPSLPLGTSQSQAHPDARHAARCEAIMTDAAYMRRYRERHREGYGPVVACACGCGSQFRQYDGYNKRPRRYAPGHNGRGKPQSEAQRAKFRATIERRKRS